ncbi:hypothetical protein [Vibrio splendidus]|uniref:hypothetical protein n=1 Tax=Vibrio splendidus TaxID=29497 RepID=UPI000D3D475D|nr:hypothetical protein [Vibrio splendidus]PTO78187.1 hypothetical protein CWN93_19890 [Vibrio splendidus]
MKNGHEVITVTTDFSHTSKGKVNFDEDNIISMPTVSYKRNTSFIRFISHGFSSIFLAYKAIRLRSDVDIYYVTAPFCITAYIIKVITRKKIVVDIVDFWPDSLPFPKSVYFKFFLKLWGWVNRYCSKYFDYTISLSSEFLKLSRSQLKEQIGFGAEANYDVNDQNKNSICTENLTVLYIGNLGNLYDFSTLISAIKSCKKKIKIEIIGDGDRKGWLLNELEKNGIEFGYHGIIYNKELIKKIASGCNVGFNGYINTNASFSYKALSYFSYSLPIINSMEGDLSKVVIQKNVGFNYVGGDVASLTSVLDNINVDQRLIDDVKGYFQSDLDLNVVENKLIQVFEGQYEKTL